MRTSGQRDTTKLVVAFRNFAKAPEITEQESAKYYIAYFFTEN